MPPATSHVGRDASKGFSRARPPHRRRRQAGWPLALRLPPLQFGLTTLLVALALLIGGGSGQGIPADSLLAILSLPLLGLGLVSLRRERQPEVQGPLVLIVCAAAWLSLQLLPLPPSVWPLLPGRAQFAETYAKAGLALPWLPISLDPAATWRSAVSLLPGLAIFTSLLTLPSRARRQLVSVLVGLSFLNVLLGLLQVMQGPDSALRFYAPYTNIGQAVGFFANRNSYAAALYAVVPLAAGAAVALVHEHGMRKGLGLAACALVYGVLIIGLATAASRAGLVLGAAAGAASVALFWRGGALRFNSRLALLVGGGAALAALLLQALLLTGLDGMESLRDEERGGMYRLAWQASLPFQPFGSGLGTFTAIYGMNETPATLSNAYVNHAHNDWVELWLENGIAAVALVGGFLVWFACRTWQAWMTSSRASGHLSLARSGSIAVLLLLIHSSVDFPLRSIACQVIFALACALLVPGPETRRLEAPRDRGRSRRRSRDDRPSPAPADSTPD
jgi:O-antigen ligase